MKFFSQSSGNFSQEAVYLQCETDSPCRVGCRYCPPLQSGLVEMPADACLQRLTPGVPLHLVTSGCHLELQPLVDFILSAQKTGPREIQLMLGPGTALSYGELRCLHQAGVTRFGFSLIASWKLLDETFRPTPPELRPWWDRCGEMADHALSLVGQGNVLLILGIGPAVNEQTFLEVAQDFIRLGYVVLPRVLEPSESLPFPTPTQGKIYRLLVGLYLIQHEHIIFEQFKFDGMGQIIDYSIPFTRFEPIIGRGIVSRSLLGAIDCAAFASSAHLGKRADDLEHPEDDVKERLERLAAFSWEEAWVTQKDIYSLAPVLGYDEDEIDGGGSVYSALGEMGRSAREQDV